jgi:hypothetical protein
MLSGGCRRGDAENLDRQSWGNDESGYNQVMSESVKPLPRSRGTGLLAILDHVDLVQPRKYGAGCDAFRRITPLSGGEAERSTLDN